MKFAVDIPHMENFLIVTPQISPDELTMNKKITRQSTKKVDATTILVHQNDV